MWRIIGAFLFVAALARAEVPPVRTVGDAIEDYLATASDEDLPRPPQPLAAGPLVTITGIPDGLLAAASPEATGTTKPWDIAGALGFTLANGNSDSITLTIGADAKREWELWKLAMKLGILYAESDGDQTASEWIFLERLERKLSERATIFQDLLLEHDEEEDLRYRIQLTFGYNRRLVKKEETFELWGNVGAGVLYESFFDASDTEGIAQLGINFTWQITKQLKYTQVITFFPSLSEGGEFRMYWESVFATPIGDRFDLRLTILDRYDSNPQPGTDGNDLTIAISLAVRFTKPPPK